VRAAGTKPRVRARLLVLLWIWAACIFAVLDLFLNVPELDRVRPDSRLYEGMRVAAHRMVGEPLDAAPAPPLPGPPSLASSLEGVRALDSVADLRRLATGAADARVRIAALRELAERFADRETLLGVAMDSAETVKVRRQAARFVGRTGAGADRALEDLLTTPLPRRVREGALAGLGECGTAVAAERLLALAGADEALALVSNPEAAPLLREALLDAACLPATRVAVCRALGRMREPASARALGDVLRDPTTPARVREAAAGALGRLGDAGALPVVRAAGDEAAPSLAWQARLAAARLSHAR